MPLVRNVPDAERIPSPVVHSCHTLNPAACLTRITRLMVELKEVEAGNTNPYFEAMRLSAGQSAAQVANDLVCLCRTLADLLDRQYPVTR
jgi:hypothetical protein